MDRLTQLSNSQDTIPTRMEFVDIAGPVKGASQAKDWEQFSPTFARWTRSSMSSVASRMTTSSMCRPVGPARDAEVINLELGLADLAQIEKRRERLKQIRTSKEAGGDAALERIQAVLENEGAARSVELSDEEAALIKPSDC